jgi:hypothetical protein
MSRTISAFDSKAWDAAGLADYGQFSDMVDDRNVREAGDHTCGDWFYSPEKADPGWLDGSRVIYSGTWGNYNAPGASSYTGADIYDAGDPEDMAEYNATLSALQAEPEDICGECFKSLDSSDSSEHCQCDPSDE